MRKPLNSPLSGQAIAVIVVSLALSLLSCQKSKPDSNDENASAPSGRSEVTHGSLKWAINVKKLAGISQEVADDLLGQPLDTLETDYTHPSWDPLKSIPSVSRVYSCDGLEVKLRFIDGAARWITVYFVDDRPTRLDDAIQLIGLDYEPPKARTDLYAAWDGLAGFYKVSAFPHDTWGQGVSYVLIITTEEYR